jgi:hypothetical protein
MLRLLIDENLDQRILRGLKLEIPGIDYLVVQEATLKGLRDPLLLAWAAENHQEARRVFLCVPLRNPLHPLR